MHFIQLICHFYIFVNCSSKLIYLSYSRQQLGKKRRRLGFRSRQKRLDPALQVMPVFVTSHIDGKNSKITKVSFHQNFPQKIFISQGLMGEANLRFVRGDTDTAIRMCMEVIRQDPAVAEPFQTLATLYDGLGKI